MKIGARSAQDRRKIGAKRQAQQSETTRSLGKIGEDRGKGTTIQNDAFCAQVRKKIKDSARAVWDAGRERLPHACVQAASEHAHAARHRPD